jgi:hypothetical protein
MSLISQASATREDLGGVSTKSLPHTLISAVSRSPEAAGMPVFFLPIRDQQQR